MNAGKNKVEHATRQVIEKQLLTSLEDKSKVALLLTESEVDILISALFLSESNRMAMPSLYKAFRLDLEQLKREAFGH